MKKILSLTLVVMFMLMATMSFADAVYTREPEHTCKILSVAPSGPGANSVELSTTISVGNRILGFTYTDTAAGTIGLWDVATTATYSAATRFGELSVAAGTGETFMFPFPKKLEYGFVYSATTSTGDLMVYYE